MQTEGSREFLQRPDSEKTEAFSHILKGEFAMFDKRNKRGPFATDRVNPHEKNEIKYWCQKLNCTEMQLKNAVTAVGTSAKAVRQFLNPRAAE